MPTASEYRSAHAQSRHSVTGGGTAGKSLYRTSGGTAGSNAGGRRGGSRQSTAPQQFESGIRHGCTGGAQDDEFRLPALPNLIAIHKRQGEEGLRTALDNFPLDIYMDGIENLHAQVAKLQRQCNQMEFALVTWQSYMHAVMNYVEQHQNCDPQLPNSEPAPPSNMELYSQQPPPNYNDNGKSHIEFPYKLAASGTTIAVPRLNNAAPISTSMLVRDHPAMDLLPSNLPGPMNTVATGNIPPGLPRAPTNDSRMSTSHALLPPLSLTVEDRSVTHSQPLPRVPSVPLGGSSTQSNNPSRFQQRRSTAETLPIVQDTIAAEASLNAHIDSLRAMVDNNHVQDLDQSTTFLPPPPWSQRPLLQDDLGPTEEPQSDSNNSSDDAENIAPRANAPVQKSQYKKSVTKSPSAAGQNTRPLLRKQQSMGSNDEGRQLPAPGEIASAVESYRADLYRESAISAQSSAAHPPEPVAVISQQEITLSPEDLGASVASSDSGYIFPVRVQMSKQQRPPLVPSLALDRAEPHKSAWLHGENTSGDFYAS